ncbi:hypothetical protein D3C78_496760 [compost metagenome]
MHHPLVLALRQLGRCQVQQLRTHWQLDRGKFGAVLIKVTAQQLMQDQARGRLGHTTQYVQPQLPGQRSHTFNYARLGGTENDNRCG